MRGPPAPAPPATASSFSSRLLPRTILPAAGCPAHASPTSLLGRSPASPAGPWGPRRPRRPPGRTLVLLLERGREEKSSHCGREAGKPTSKASCQDKVHPWVWDSWEGSQLSALSPFLSSGIPHLSVELTTSTATFSFSSKRPFRGAVTATPSSSAFLRSSSIS